MFVEICLFVVVKRLNYWEMIDLRNKSYLKIMSSHNLDSKLIRFRPKEGIFDIICFFNKKCTIIFKEILEFKYSIFIYLCIQNSYLQDMRNSMV